MAEDFIARSVYYVSRSIAEQGYRGHSKNDSIWKYDLTPVIGVFFCNFQHSELPSKAVTKGGLTDYETGEHLGHYTRYVYIQLPLFVKQEYDCKTLIDQWIYNIKNMGPMQNVAFTRENAVFQRLANVGSVASLTESERRLYEADLKFARDYYAQITDAREQSEAIGMEKGIKKGIKQGLEKGIKQGKEEGVTTVAIELLRLNQPVTLVAKATGLPLQTVQKLKEGVDAE